MTLSSAQQARRRAMWGRAGEWRGQQGVTEPRDRAGAAAGSPPPLGPRGGEVKREGPCLMDWRSKQWQKWGCAPVSLQSLKRVRVRWGCRL